MSGISIEELDSLFEYFRLNFLLFLLTSFIFPRYSTFNSISHFPNNRNEKAQNIDNQLRQLPNDIILQIKEGRPLVEIILNFIHLNLSDNLKNPFTVIRASFMITPALFQCW